MAGTDIKLSASLEDYIEALYEIYNEKQGVKAIDIAKRLGVGRSSVTEALKNLANKNLINYGRYDVISLTDQGETVALRVIEKHKTLYDFLHNILEIPSDVASENACKMEHIISDEVLDKLIQFINNYKEK